MADALGALHASAAAAPPSADARTGGAGAHAARVRDTIEGEIDGLRLAMASESQAVADRIARLERENSYLNAQLQMEQKKQAEYRESVRAARREADEAVCVCVYIYIHTIHTHMHVRERQGGQARGRRGGVCVCVCVCVCMYVCVYINIYIYIFIYILCVYIYIYIHIHIIDLEPV